MLNVDLYRAEADYRRETLRREFRPFFGRRAAKAATRNQIAADARRGLGA
jgi:hypothetical protein